MVVLILANSADPDEMQQYAAFHQGLHCLPKYLFILLHFIWLFSVCQSTRLVISSRQRFKCIFLLHLYIFILKYLRYHRHPDKIAYQKIIFLISQPKHMLWVLIRTVSMRQFFEHPKRMFKLLGKKIITILR